MKIESKLPDVGVTIFTTMSKLAADHEALNLSQGFPEFDASPELVELVAKHMREHKNQYAPMQGIPLLLQKIAEKTHSIYGADVDPNEEINLTAGATEALFSAITAVVRPGEEVILFEPAYDSYLPVVKLSGGIPVFLQMKYPDYHIDWNEVKDAISEKTRLIIINSPHNPTGTIFSQRDMQALIDIVEQTGIFIISDEVYEHMVFDGERHESIMRYPELSRRSFVISSFGKTYHTTGWKTGYCIATAPLMKEFRRVHQYVTFAVNTPIQFAYAEFLDKPDHYLNLPAFYQEKRDRFLSVIKNSRFKPLPCRGTYFQVMDYSEISDDGDVEFSRWLTTEKNIASIPTSVFYHRGDDHNVLRFCFAKNNDTLDRAGEILSRI